MLTITPEALQAIHAHGEASYPNEGVGLLLGTFADGHSVATATLGLENTWPAEEQFHRYQVSGEDMLKAEKEAARLGLDILGFFHSHPDSPAQPSRWDHEWATWPGYSYVITTVVQGRATVTRSWQLRADRSAFDEEKVLLP